MQSIKANANITSKEYRAGKWETNTTSPEEFFDFLATPHHHLIDGLKIGKLLRPIGNEYKKIRIDITADNDNQFGIKTTRKDYYENLKHFCLTLRLYLIKTNFVQGI